MNARRLAFVVALAASSLAFTQQASAQYGAGCGGFGGLGYGSYLGVGDLYRVLAQNVPYYAAFPPVYYSTPVPRTYGYSPFAYLPHVQTPEVATAVEPAVIENPYFPPKEPATTSADVDATDQTTHHPIVRPLTIHNPYVLSAVESLPALQAAR